MRKFGDRVVLRDMRRDIVVTFGLLKQDMFDKTFFSQGTPFKVVWLEKPLLLKPSFLISCILSTTYCCLEGTGLCD